MKIFNQACTAGLVLLLLFVVACSAAKPTVIDANANGTAVVQPALTAGLPALSDLAAAAPRRTTAEDAQLISGIDAMVTSGFFFDQGSSAQLGHPDGGFAYAIYAFDLAAGDTVDRLETAISTNMAGKTFWLGFSDFGQQRWQFVSSNSNSPTIQASGLPATFSNGTSAYVAVLSYFDGGLIVDSLTLIKEAVGPVSDWEHTWDNSGNENLHVIGVDADSNVYAAGFAESGNAGEAGPMILLKYTAGGALVKARQWRVPVEDFSSEAIQPVEMKVDPDGNCYILTSQSLSPFFHFGIMKVDSQLDLVWSRLYNGLQEDFPLGMALSPDGSKLVITADSYLAAEDLNTVSLILTLDAASGDEISTEYISVDGSAYVSCTAFASDGSLIFGGSADVTEGTGGLIFTQNNLGQIQAATVCNVSGIYGITTDASDNLICSAEENNLDDYGDTGLLGILLMKLDPTTAWLDGAVIESAGATGYYSAGPITANGTAYEMRSAFFDGPDHSLGPLTFDANLDFTSFFGFYESSSLNPINYGLVRDGSSYLLAASADDASDLHPAQVINTFASVTPLSMGDVTFSSINLSKSGTTSYLEDQAGEFADEAGFPDPELKIENDAYTARRTPMT